MPRVAPRVEGFDNLPRVDVSSGQIGSLGEIAANTRSCQVGQFVGSPVLPGNNMFDLVTPKSCVMLPQSAVFTAVTRPFPNGTTCFPIH